jgi:formylglycine-generating enzyme
MRNVIFLCLVPAILLLGGCGKNPTGDMPWPRGMKLIEGGTFQMGALYHYNAGPVHSATVSSFYMDLTEVTQEDYQALTGKNPSDYPDNPRWPVNEVSWYDAVLYCNARSKRDHLDTVYCYTKDSATTPGGFLLLSGIVANFMKNGYRLPTEAEWEYACRAGTTTNYYWGNSMDGRYCWYAANSVTMPNPVATKLPNAWGLYDMSGNVAEWCNDWYADRYSSVSSIDPKGPAEPSKDYYLYRVTRGGSCYEYDSPTSVFAYSGHRGGFNAYAFLFCLGFRCVRSADVHPVQ